MKINFKKITKIISINILVILFIVTIISIYIETLVKNDALDSLFNKININFTSKQNQKYNININDYDLEKNSVIKIELNDETYNSFCGENRVINEEVKTDKKPIIILGCSYAYGHGLQKEETFPSILNKITKRPVYNYATCGSNIIESYKNLYNDSKNIKETRKAEYVIYLYMYEHINRYLMLSNLYSNYDDLFLQDTKSIKNKLLHFPLIRLIFCVIKQQEIYSSFPFSHKSEQFLKLIIQNIQNKLREQFPNSKLIIIIYNEKLPNEYELKQAKYFYDNENSKIWKELENETDIKIIKTKDIMGFKFDSNYKLKKDVAGWHPNEKVWKEFTPKFASKYIK